LFRRRLTAFRRLHGQHAIKAPSAHAAEGAALSRRGAAGLDSDAATCFRQPEQDEDVERANDALAAVEMPASLRSD
jgi:hypothetical protein